MKRCCKKNGAYWPIVNDSNNDAWQIGVAVRCRVCRAWLSLGPSNDSDERVRVEIRAAEIAASVREPIGVFICEDLTACERMGWCGWIDEQSLGVLAEHAGYLARCIAEHKDSP